MSKSKDLFAEKLYDTLRSYDNGEFDNYGVAVGKLTPPLTQVFDRVRSFADDYAEECIKDERKRIAELEKALDYCDKRCASLHHPKKYQHGDSPECPVEALVNKALRRSAE